MRSKGILTMGTAFPRVPPRNVHWYNPTLQKRTNRTTFNERLDIDISISINTNTYNESHKKLRIPERYAHLHTFCQTQLREISTYRSILLKIHTLFLVET